MSVLCYDIVCCTAAMSVSGLEMESQYAEMEVSMAKMDV